MDHMRVIITCICIFGMGYATGCYLTIRNYRQILTHYADHIIKKITFAEKILEKMRRDQHQCDDK